MIGKGAWDYASFYETTWSRLLLYKDSQPITLQKVWWLLKPWSRMRIKSNNLPFLGLTAWFPIPAEVSTLDTCSQDKSTKYHYRTPWHAYSCNNAVRHRPLRTLSCFIDFLSDIWFYLNFNSVLHQFLFVLCTGFLVWHPKKKKKKKKKRNTIL